MENVFIIAEAGVNHNGELEKALELVDVAADAGADAVKFQTFNAERLAAMSAPKASYQKDTTDAEESQFEMLRQLELPAAWHETLQERAHDRGMEFLSTAFDLQSLAFLESINLPRYKIPSGEITNGPLLWQFAQTGKDLILSTGMSTLGEIELALAILAHGVVHETEPQGLEEVWRHWSEPQSADVLQGKLTLLHCTSRYPTPMEDVNLRAMDTLQGAFGLPAGYSDHTQGLLVPVAASARGATVIEKHFTLDRELPGPDHRASLEPHELVEMVEQIRSTSQALGNGRKHPQSGEWDTRGAARQQIIAAERIQAGESFSRDSLTTARCGGGQPPYSLWGLVGTRAQQDFSPGDPVPE